MSGGGSDSGIKGIQSMMGSVRIGLGGDADRKLGRGWKEGEDETYGEETEMEAD